MKTSCCSLADYPTVFLMMDSLQLMDVEAIHESEAPTVAVAFELRFDV